MRQRLNRKTHAHFANLADDARASVQSDWRDREQLKKSKDTIASQLNQLNAADSELTGAIAAVEAKTLEVRDWLAENGEANKEAEAASVDDVCRPVSKLHAQMLDLSAENAALTDALYFLDRAMYQGRMDCTTHLKSVRKLAKRQFFIRAHLIKIDGAVSK